MNKGIFLGMLGKQIDKIEIYDERFEKPYISIENGNQEILYQNIDEFLLEGKNIDVFRIHQISINMSMSKRYYEKSKKIYKELCEFGDVVNENHQYNREYLIKKSKKLCDYIESVQEAIIFSYTSVEAFVNLSIPETYEYKVKKSEGRFEVYDSYAIQRNIALKDKIKNIICKIYKVDNLINEKFWSDFCMLEQIRNDIIHLKNMKYDELIQKFLNPQVFEYIEAANKLIEYIILSNQTIEGGTTIGNEHLWPIIDNKILTIYAHESCLSLDDSTPVSKD